MAKRTIKKIPTRATNPPIEASREAVAAPKMVKRVLRERVHFADHWFPAGAEVEFPAKDESVYEQMNYLAPKEAEPTRHADGSPIVATTEITPDERRG